MATPSEDVELGRAVGGRPVGVQAFDDLDQHVVLGHRREEGGASSGTGAPRDSPP
jgi:hypothetical protein